MRMEASCRASVKIYQSTAVKTGDHSFLFNVTLNALVPGCCCLDAGFWWSVAIMNGSARIKLEKKEGICTFT